MNIRKATIEDMEILIKLRFDYLLADRGKLTADEVTTIRSQLTTYYAKHINHGFIALLAEIDNNVVSTAFLAISEKPANPAFITGKTGTLLNVFTYPEYRRMGFATNLICQIIGEAKQLGMSSIDLSATQDGKLIYEKLGFIESKSKYTPMKLQLV
jgi:ribosomal protein S18 acetylase RimI-like enzyme